MSRSDDERHAMYRRSYVKTVWVAFAVALLCCVAIVGPPEQFIPEAVQDGLLAACLTALLAAVSGVIVVYRHDRELRGEPDLFWLSLRQAEAKPPRGVFRALFGPRLRAGTIVRVRSEAEIRRTLDAQGQTAGIPFMPEMSPCCGRSYRVHRVIDKINDWGGRTGTGLRRLKGFVSLRDVRCDGSAHGGCQANCQILWHESWLERVEGADVHVVSNAPDPERCLRVHQEIAPAIKQSTYTCQITELVRASTPMHRWDLRQDWRPLISGNVSAVGFSIAKLTALFNAIQRLRRGLGYPMMPQQLSHGPTPTQSLGLMPGDRVISKSKAEIGATLHRNYNRGLWFGAETMRFCGQPFHVLSRIERMLDENTGSMIMPKTPFISLGGVTATGEFLRFCPQNEYVYWREIWLVRNLPREVRDGAS